MSSGSVRIELQPSGRVLSASAGGSLREMLFPLGVEFPCGGKGRCRGCRVRIIAGGLEITEADGRMLTSEALGAGWRLACQARPQSDAVIAIEQWDGAVLADSLHFDFQPRDGLGIAVDLGTTTLAAQLIDLRSGQVLGVETAFNCQAVHGADVMSRIEYAVEPGAASELASAIRGQIGGMIERLLHGAELPALCRVILVGNSAMHHLFGGLNVLPLARFPFEPEQPGPLRFSGAELGWRLDADVWFLPCIGGFVGSDILAGILATGLDRAAEPRVLIDLGTNGEIVLAWAGRVLCTSTAAGPAFEGARISSGMRAAPGAIASVTAANGQMHCEVLGGKAPRGICGSGLVDAAAAALETGALRPDGRIEFGNRIDLAPPVFLTQKDIRELQLAKGAIAAGLLVLLDRAGLRAEEVVEAHLAGAFGNHISRAGARRIGLLPFEPEKISSAGNSALRGAKIALFLSDEALAFHDLRRQIEHVRLNEDPRFNDAFVGSMPFPSRRFADSLADSQVIHEQTRVKPL